MLGKGVLISSGPSRDLDFDGVHPVLRREGDERLTSVMHL